MYDYPLADTRSLLVSHCCFIQKYKLKRSWGGQLTGKTILTHVHMFSKAGPTGLHKPAFVLDMFSGLLCLYEQHIDGTGEKNVQKERVNDM